MLHKVMCNAAAAWDEVDQQGHMGHHPRQPEGDAERHAHPEVVTWTCPLCALLATLVLGDVPSPSFAANIAPILLPSSSTQRIAPFFQPFSFPARAPPYGC